LLCILVLGGGRPIALRTPSLRLVYVLYAAMIVALGVMNTAITTACSGLAQASDDTRCCFYHAGPLIGGTSAVGSR
jgi:hypothetical protein